MKKVLLKLVKVEELTPTVKEFTFTSSDGVIFKTGQWMMLELPEGGQIFKRSMSIASPEYEKNKLDFCVKRVPNGRGGSKAMHLLSVGQTIQASGPFGLFTLRAPFEGDIMLIAAGSGISPFKAMILDLLKDKKVKNEVYLLFGNRTEDEIIYKIFFEELAKEHKNFHFIPVLSRAGEEWGGENGRVQDLVKKYFSSGKNKDVYICGMKEMVLDVVALLEEKEFDSKRIYFERYN